MAALPGFLLPLIMIHRDRNLYEAKAKQEALQLLQQAVLKKYNLVNNTKDLLKQLSKQPEVMGANATACNQFMANLRQKYPFYTTLGVVNPDGLATCSAIPMKGSVRADDRLWFQRAIQTRNFAVGKYQIGKITNLPIVSFAYPVVDSAGAVQSVIFASLDLSYINQLVAAEQLSPGTTVSVIDREGTILVRSPEGAKWVGKSIRDTPLFRELSSSKGQTVTVETFDADGVPHIFALGRLLPQELPELTMVIGIPEENVQAQVVRNLTVSLLLVLFVTGAALAIAGWFSQQFIQRPIARLQAATDQMTAGDLQARVEPPYGTRQLERLAVTFNDMADALEHHIAERATVQQERERAELELRFVSVVSHELRAPLSTLQMIAEMFETFGERISEERKQSYLRQLRILVDQMTQLMNDVLLIRRAETANLQIRRSRLDFADFCQNLIRSLQVGDNQERAIALDCQGDCSNVWLDETLLQSILTNLLTNAMKYSSPETTVYLDLNCTEQTVILQVRDEGIGIPVDDQARLFEMFYRAGNVGSISGTGLGLAIVKRFVDLLQGEMTVESVVNVGTTFRVVLPLLPEAVGSGQ